jgi:hypothetical protein
MEPKEEPVAPADTINIITVYTETPERSWPRIWLFLVATILTAGVAFWLFPDRASVFTPGPLMVELTTSADVQDITLDVTHIGNSHTSGMLSLTIVAGTLGTVTVGFSMPNAIETNGSTCQYVSVPQVSGKPKTSCTKVVPTVTLVRNSTTGEEVGTWTIRYTGYVVGWNENGLDLMGVVPQVGLCMSYPWSGGVDLGVNYAIPDVSSYDWAANSQWPLIQATVGSLGGTGGREKRLGLAA